MSTRDFTANVISATKVVPDGNFKDSKASGVWDINEALDLIKGGNWPNVANINPASFVDALFSVDVWDGDGTDSNTITSGIDLSNKGGLLWIKPRNVGLTNNLFDTERGFGTTFGYRLISDLENAQSERADALSAFNSNGFTLGNSTSVNGSSYNYVSWTFRKQPKFFDVVTYSGQNTDLALSHNLGVAPGMVIVKRTDTTGDWYVYHRSLNLSENLTLNSTGDVGGNNFWTSSAPSSTVFNIDGNRAAINQSGGTYVAYLFAHNNDDGGFGEPGDQDIIKCGSYTGNGSSTGPVVTLGFEPQFIMIKAASRSGEWIIHDNMRGMAVGGDDAFLIPNSSGAEQSGARVDVTATGFNLTTSGTIWNDNNQTYIYMAIRRGGMQTPTAGTDVFAINVRSSSDGEGKYTSGFPVDFSLANNYDATGNTFAGTRLLNEHLQTNDNVTAGSSASDYEWDHNDGVSIGASGGFFGGSTNNINWMWKRARGYFDVVVYEGPDSTGNFSHNLGVVPEMIWVKNTDATENWAVYHKDLGNTYYLHLNTNAAASNTDGGNFWNSTTPTASVFSVGTSTLTSHYTRRHVAYLFATAAGVSKVGSYTGNGSSQNIDCGFSGGTGARFVLIKNADATGSWVIFDTTRGLVAGNDNYLRLDVTNAQGGGYDFIDPLESGFTINQTGGVVLNESGETYIFYAIA